MCRPSTYDPEYHPVMAAMYAREGATREEIGRHFGKCRDTIREWEKRYPAFADALKEGEVADAKVEHALFTRATGFDYEEVQTTTFPDGNTFERRTTKKVLPDPTSMIFWLKNRQRKKWRTKPIDEDNDTNDAETLPELRSAAAEVWNGEEVEAE